METLTKSHCFHDQLYEKACNTHCTNLFIIYEVGATLYATFPIGSRETISGFSYRGFGARN